jgi:hypothetical protein
MASGATPSRDRSARRPWCSAPEALSRWRSGVDTRSCSEVRADVEDFREARRQVLDEDPPTRAQRIADGLIRCQTLRGLDQRAVARVLGRPDDTGRSAQVDLADRQWGYTIGPWRGWFPIDYELLTVGFDGRGPFVGCGSCRASWNGQTRPHPPVAASRLASLGSSITRRVRRWFSSR